MLREIHTKMYPILNGYGVTTSWNLEKKVGIGGKICNKIINRQCLIYLKYSFSLTS